MSAGTADSTPKGLPDATYRLQYNKDFTFAQARALVDYLADLGVSHIYASPFLKARAGSTHGYDIVDHRALNPEVGTAADLDALTAALKQRGMGQIMDFVPNHMGVGEADNPWWLDVLEYGESSPYAEFFDIDFQPAKVELRGKVLLPVLGDQYGRVLEDGDFKLKLDPATGSLSVWYWDHRFPVTPYRYADILGLVLPALRKADPTGEAVAALDALVAGFRDIRRTVRSGRARVARRQKAERLKERFAALLAAHPGLSEGISAGLDAVHGTPGDPPSFMRLHRLLEAQHYRLAFWRTASDEINYRRFFQINDLAGLRAEVPAVFDASHDLVLRLLADGRIDGIRIDHIDGLFDPKGYLDRLQDKARAATGSDRDVYVLVEKILGHHERLRTDWRCAGTTGYEALNEINGLFVDPAAEAALTDAYADFTGQSTDFEALVRDCKRQVMRVELASEVQVLVNGLNRLSERDWRTRDYTMRDIRMALEEVIACFPVYRTYIDRRRPSAEDLRDIEWAIAQARKAPHLPDEGIFDYLWSILSADAGRRKGDPYPRAEVLRLARKAQQVTSPVMAKGLEDTAFYRFNRLVSLNEVGGHPDVFGTKPDHFHRRMAQRATLWPHAMLTTATHDTKRGEDVRARIDALSEMPEAWAERARKWARINRRAKPEIDGAPVPSANDEYLFYQVLTGAWPPGLTVPAEGGDAATLAALDELTTRLQAYMVKAVREAKQHSSWTRQNDAYEQGTTAWVARVLNGRRRNAFLADFQPFQARVARIGAVNGLAQAALKLTCPGVPDIYQGCELWEFSLVDPDNRRPVDFQARRTMLAGLRDAFDGAGIGAGDAGVGAGGAGRTARGLLDAWPDSRIKLLLVWRLLRLRREYPDLFRCGDYRPVEVVGRYADRILAFERRTDTARLVVAVPRLVQGLMPGDGDWPVADVWQDTRLLLETPGTWRHAIAATSLAGATLPVRDILRDVPVGVLLEA